MPRSTPRARARAAAAAVRRLRGGLAGTTAIAILAGATVVFVPAVASAATTRFDGQASAAQSVGGSDVDYTQYVDPFMGTQSDDGQELPGAFVPNGLAIPNPLTANHPHTGYDYAQTQIAGFTTTNIGGAGGGGDGGDVLVVPSDIAYTTRPPTASYLKTFAHTNETATPGYYEVKLKDTKGTNAISSQGPGQIDAQVTATTRTAVEQYTFPANNTPSLVIDLDNSFSGRVSSGLSVSTLPDGRGVVSGQFTGGGTDYQMYFYATTTVPVASISTWGDLGALSNATAQSGVDTGAVLAFAPSATAQAVGLDVTLSTISSDQAQRDQVAELGASSTFAGVRAAAAAQWNTMLGKVAVTDSATADPDGSMRKIFYTSLYRMLAQPMNATSTDGTWRGLDGKVHPADGYVHYDSWYMWDAFRNFSTMAELYPSLYHDEVQSLVDLLGTASDGKSLGSYLHAVPTVRFERTAVVVDDALSKGFQLDGLAQAWPALVKLDSTYSAADTTNGYIADQADGTVGTAYDDWAMSGIATALGRSGDAASYLLRAQNYRNVLKPGSWTAPGGQSVSVLQGKSAAGAWGTTQQDIYTQNTPVYEGTLWQYNWYDTADLAGLFQAMGGTAAAQQALSNMFGEQSPNDGSKMLYTATNEQDLQLPWLFDSLGMPSHTQYWVRNIYAGTVWNRYLATKSTPEYPSSAGALTPPLKLKVYNDSSRGLMPTMDDDAGTMSSNFVSAALGLYPVTAGSDEYAVGTPFFPRVDISYDNGAAFSITADGVSPSSYYIQSATLNGSALNNTWLRYSDMVNGGQLGFETGATASHWGESSARGYSMSTASAGDLPEQVTGQYPLSVDKTVLAAAADGSLDGTDTLTLGGGAAFAAVGSDLLASGAASIGPLPNGVSATLIATTATSAALHLVGDVSGLGDSVFTVHFADAAFAGGVTAAQVVGPGTDVRTPLTITTAAYWRAQLGSQLADAQGAATSSYAPSSTVALTTAISGAQTALAGDSDTGTLRAALSALADAAAQLSLTSSWTPLALPALTAANASSSSANLSTDVNGLNLTAPPLIQDTNDSEWIEYAGLNFGVAPPTDLAITYDLPKGKGPTGSTWDARIEVRLGSQTGQLVDTLPVAPTSSGSTWGTYQTITYQLANPAAFTGRQAVFFVFRGTGAIKSTAHYVGNFAALQFGGNAGVLLEAESYSAHQGGTIKSTTSNATPMTAWTDGSSFSAGGSNYTAVDTVTAVSGLHDGDWLKFSNVDFTAGYIASVDLHYSNSSSTDSANASVAVALDSPTNSSVSTMRLTATGSDARGGSVVTGRFSTALTGRHDVYLKFSTGTTDASHTTVGQVDWAYFRYASDAAGVQSAIDAASPLLAQTDRLNPIDVGVATAAVASATGLIVSGGTKQQFAFAAQQVNAAAAVLNSTLRPIVTLENATLVLPVGASPTWSDLDTAAGASVAGGTLSPYSLTGVDFGTAGVYQVSVTGAELGVTAIPAALAVVVVAPAIRIAGQVRVGSTVSAQIQQTALQPSGIQYQWSVGGVLAQSDASADFAVPVAAAGSPVTVVASLTGPAYSGVPLTSAPVVAQLGVIAAAAPVISGTVAVGQMVAAAVATLQPAVVGEYQWLIDGSPLDGATNSTLSIPASAVGELLSVRIGYTATGYADLVSYSDPVEVSAAAFSGEVSVTISGLDGALEASDARTGDTVTAEISGSWTPASDSIGYQWLVGGVPIPAATLQSFTIPRSYQGRLLSVAVRGTRSGYADAQAISAPIQIDGAELGILAQPTLTGYVGVGSTVGFAPPVLTESGTSVTRIQWYLGDSPIDGATESSYAPTADQWKQSLSVEVTSELDGFDSAVARSLPIAIGDGALTEKTPPSVAGTASFGHTLTAIPGTYSPAAESVGYRWLRNGSPIAGATGERYTLGAADLGAKLAVRVSVAVSGYGSTSFTSAATSLVAALSFAIRVPAIPHTIAVGKKVAVSVGTWTPNPVSYAYQWLRDGKAIKGATKPSYTAAAADSKHKLSIKVTGTRSGYTTASTTSAQVKVAPGALAHPSKPTIAGTAKVGKKLTAKPGSWTSGVKLGYQWYAGTMKISGATKSSYTIAAKYRGKKISVKVAGTKDGYNSVTIASAATKAVAR